MSLLEVREVTKRSGGLLALHHVSCTIEQGQITSVIGPNGAGKTTLFNLIAGEFSPDAGRILLQGEPIHHLPSNAICRRGIARTVEMVRPFLGLTTLNNVIVAVVYGRAQSPPQRQAQAMARRWLEFMGLEEKAGVPASGLMLAPGLATVKIPVVNESRSV